MVAVQVSYPILALKKTDAVIAVYVGEMPLKLPL